ncbi:MAG: hypothetical protein WCJ71_10645, partial [Candidatus Omnitrophota bacterium]
VKQVLKPGGRLVSLNPTFNQIEKMAEALREQGFILVEARELLEREILARAGKTRPVQRMIGHTEFMLFAVRPADEAVVLPGDPVVGPADPAPSGDEISH